LWWDAKGNWKQAHESAQQDESPAGSWVHAYLHRKEGDTSNAGYWYRRAAKAPAEGSLQQEWPGIVESLFSEAGPDLEHNSSLVVDFCYSALTWKFTTAESFRR